MKNKNTIVNVIIFGFCFFTWLFLDVNRVLANGFIGDANNDGQVDGLDYLICKTDFLSLVSDSTCDLNVSGRVEGGDIVMWKNSFLAGGLLPQPSAPPSNTATSVKGAIETVNCEKISGWAWDSASVNSSLKVLVYKDKSVLDGGELIATITTDKTRSDLVTSGDVTGSGKVGFDVGVPDELKDGQTHKVFAIALDAGESGIKELAGSPKDMVACEPTLTPAQRMAMGYYRLILNRSDIDGSKWHGNIIENEGCLRDLHYFFESEEFAPRKGQMSDEEYTAMVFKAVVSRDPTDSDVAWFVERLRNGTVNRESLIDLMYESPEATRVCNERKPYSPQNTPGLPITPPPGVTVLPTNAPTLSSLTRGQSLAVSYYKRFLGWDMSPTHEHVQIHANYIEQNGCLADIREFMKAQDFENRKNSYTDEQYAEMFFTTLTTRKDEAGIRWWADRLADGTYNRDNMVDAMFGSSEVQNVCSTGKVYEGN